MSNIVDSIYYLFEKLRISNVSIVVLRNYEFLPDIGNDLDTAIYYEDIEIVRKILSSAFFKDRWTNICEIKTHNSKIKEHNIYIFKFFNWELDEYMQIDFFQGFVFKGQPILSINDFIKKKRVLNEFPIVSEFAEVLIKYYQIFDAINDKEWKRVAKYSNSLYKVDSELINGLNIKDLNSLLENNKFEEFKKTLRDYRTKRLRIIFFNNPFIFVKNSIYRIGSFYRFYISTPFTAECIFSDKMDKSKVVNVLNQLIEKKCFRNYILQSDNSFLQRMLKLKKISQSGGVIVKFKKGYTYLDDENDIKKYIISEFVNNHTKVNNSIR